MVNKIEAMILAAGKGSRMQAHNSAIPKPLVEISGKPLINYALDVVKNAGIDEVVVNTHHLAEQIEAHLTKQPFSFAISREDELLETGGGICRALPLLADNFFTMNSDVICIENGSQSVLNKMRNSWNDSKMDGLMLLCPLEKAVGYKGDGDFSLNENGQIQPKQDGKPAYVYMGIQLLNKRFLYDSPTGAFSLSKLYKKAVNMGDNCPLYGIIHDGAWLHVGDPEGVKLAENYLTLAAASAALA